MQSTLSFRKPRNLWAVVGSDEGEAAQSDPSGKPEADQEPNCNQNDINDHFPIGAKYFYIPFLFFINYMIFRSDLWTLCCDWCPPCLTWIFALQN